MILLGLAVSLAAAIWLVLTLLAVQTPGVVPAEPSPPEEEAPATTQPAIPPVEQVGPVALTGSVEIDIVTDASGLGVNGAVILIYAGLATGEELGPEHDPTLEAITDRRGRVVARNLRIGGCTVLVTTPGRVLTQKRLVRSFVVTAGAVHQVRIEVPEGGVLRGVVRDPRGDPVAGALVRVLPAKLLEAVGGAARADPGLQVIDGGITRSAHAQKLALLLRVIGGGPRRGLFDVTAEDGSYQIVGIPASVPMHAAGSMATGNQMVAAFASEYAPVMARVAVAVDAPVRRDLEFERAGLGVRGVVRDGDDPIGGVLVDALIGMHGGEQQVFPMRSDEFGAFEVPAVLDPDQVERVDLVALDPARGWATATVDESAATPIELALGRTGAVEIATVDEQGAPLAGATLRLAMHYLGQSIPMHIYTDLPDRFLLPVEDSRFGFTGGVQPPAGRHCQQPGDGIFVAAYDLDDSLLLADDPSLVFLKGDLR